MRNFQQLRQLRLDEKYLTEYERMLRNSGLIFLPSEDVVEMLQAPRPEAEMTPMERAIYIADKTGDNLLTRYIMFFQIANLYFVHHWNSHDIMNYFCISEKAFRYACNLFSGRKILDMIRNRVEQNRAANI